VYTIPIPCARLQNLSRPSTSAGKQYLAIEQQPHPLSIRSVVWTPLSHLNLPRKAGPKLEAFADNHARHYPREQRHESGRTKMKRPFLKPAENVPPEPTVMLHLEHTNFIDPATAAHGNRQIQFQTQPFLCHPNPRARHTTHDVHSRVWKFIRFNLWLNGLSMIPMRYLFRLSVRG
jgi:hypothetical protein